MILKAKEIGDIEEVEKMIPETSSYQELNARLLPYEENPQSSLSKKDDFILARIYEICKNSKDKNIQILTDKIKNIFLIHNKNYVKHMALSLIAKKKTNGLTVEDLCQEGSIKLLVAVDKYNYKTGNKFITYANYWIKQGMTSAINAAKLIRIPAHANSYIVAINKAKAKLMAELNRIPTLKELAIESGLTIEDIEECSKYSLDTVYYEASSPDTDDSSATFENILFDSSEPSLEEKICNESLTDVINTVLKTLNERERKVIILKYGLNGEPPKTLAQIGRSMNLSREMIRQIEGKALKNLRHPSRSNYFKDYL